jgi:hypothetical protein
MDWRCSLPLTGFGRGFEARGADRHVKAIAISTIGVDTGKNTLHLVGLHSREATLDNVPMAA